MEHKSARTIKRIGKIGKCVFQLILVLMACAAIGLGIASVALSLNSGLLPSDADYNDTMYHMLNGLVVCIILVFVFYYLSKLAKNLGEDESPFVMDNVHIMKRVALVSALGFVLHTVLRSILMIVFDISIDMSDLDFTPLFISLIVYFLALVFQYGVELQEESDSFL